MSNRRFEFQQQVTFNAKNESTECIKFTGLVFCVQIIFALFLMVVLLLAQHVFGVLVSILFFPLCVLVKEASFRSNHFG